MRRKKKQGKKEQKLQTRISDYINLKYPGTQFLCDVAAGMKFSIGMSMLVKRWRSNKGLPDAYIFSPKGKYLMLQLELKSDDASLFKKDGTLTKNPHLEEQAAMHSVMKNLGYMALFTKGYEHTTAVIDWYMNGAEGHYPIYGRDTADERQLNFLQKK